MKFSNWYLSILILFVFAQVSLSQVVYTDPSFPTQQDDIILYFDASKGNAALKGFTGTVYAHTGVITNQSSNGSDWRHVIGEWGTSDERVAMKREGDDLYSLAYNINEFYSIPAGEIVRQLAFVFRNTAGSIVGRDVDGSDIFLEVYEDNAALVTDWSEPTEDLIIYVDESFPVVLNINQQAEVVIRLNDDIVFDQLTSEVSTSFSIAKEGKFLLSAEIKTDSESVIIERNVFVIKRDLATKNQPADVINGLNVRTNDKLIFALTAPGKEHVFLLCPANEFSPSPEYRMTPNDQGTVFWIELPKSTFPEGENYYQYLVDGVINVADPFSTTILDPANDGQIIGLESTYPEHAQGHVSIADIWEEPFDWQVNNFEVPTRENLLIYELLLRDFLSDQQFSSLKDTLDYLERLGINAIELMPIQEFEGNQSWGYNPSYHMALDKAYGTREEFKQLVDECHKRGIAVILDVVYNHAFSQSPLCQMYWDATNAQPATNNPWLNPTARHPFNVGHDFNHESPYTQEWVKQVLQYWIEEYRVDGFRFDLSKGFTQRNSVGDPDRMSQFDQGRVDILTEYADHIWSLDRDNIVILEHFADLQEETVLANTGMLLWNNNQWEFAEAAMGYDSDLSGADYTDRGLTSPSLVTYLESHDEERMAYKISKYGNSSANYNTKNLETLTERMVAAYTIFMSIPGPKMVWQFSELGYDESINRCVSGSVNDNCRLDPKPIRWSFQNSALRQDLYQKLSALFTFKKNTPTFNSKDFEFDDQDPFWKVVKLYHDEMDIVAIANFSVTGGGWEVSFPQTGTWYEFFTSEEFEVNQTQQTIELNPGGYKIFTSVPSEYAGTFTTSVSEPYQLPIEVYPNPVFVEAELLITRNVNRVQVYALDGKKLLDQQGSISNFNIKGFPDGLYLIKLFENDHVYTRKVIKQ